MTTFFWLNSGNICNRVSWLPDEVDDAADGFPFVSAKISREELCERIREQLRPYPRATALVEAYLENFSWFFRPVQRDQAFEELLPDVYAWSRAANENASGPKAGSVYVPELDMHNFALMLAVLACGALADLTLPPDNDEAPVYYRLARAALSQEDLFGIASLTTVQAVSLLGAYDLYSCTRNSLEFSWKMLSFAMVLGTSVSDNDELCSS